MPTPRPSGHLLWLFATLWQSIVLMYAPVWSWSSHTGLVDVQLNSSMRLVSGTLCEMPLHVPFISAHFHGSEPHLIHGSLDPQESVPIAQMASRSVKPFCTAHSCVQHTDTHTQTMLRATSVTVGCILCIACTNTIPPEVLCIILGDNSCCHVIVPTQCKVATVYCNW